MNNEQGSAVSVVMRLHGVQGKINSLLQERDRLIQECHGHVSVRELARFLGMSPAQVSRIQNKHTRRSRGE